MSHETYDGENMFAEIYELYILFYHPEWPWGPPTPI